MKTSFCVCCFRLIHEAHKHTITVGGLRIHALLQSTFEVSSTNARRASLWAKTLKSTNHTSLTCTFFFPTSQAAQISRASPAWQSYIKYVSGVVMEGLKASTCTSLRSMLNQIVCSNMSQVFDFMALVLSAITCRNEIKKGFPKIS